MEWVETHLRKELSDAGTVDENIIATIKIQNNNGDI